MQVAVLIAIYLSILTFIFRKSKLITILFFIYIWLMIGWNFYNGDYDAYKIRYEMLEPFNLMWGEYEVGYNFIMSIFKFQGYSFQLFFIIVSFLILLFILIFILKFSNFPAILVTFFFWIYLPLDFVLFRNFIAFVILLLGLIPVLKGLKKSKIILAFSIILAASVHISSVFYSIFLITPFGYKLNIRKVSIYIFISFFFYIAVRQAIAIYIGESAMMRMEVYNSNLNMFIIYSLFQYINILFIKHFTKTDSTDNISSVVIYNINVLMLFLIIFYYDMTIFVRVFRNLSFINVLFFVNYIPLNKRKLQNIFLLVLYLLFFYFHFIYPVKDDTINSLFKFNLLYY